MFPLVPVCVSVSVTLWLFSCPSRSLLLVPCRPQDLVPTIAGKFKSRDSVTLQRNLVDR